MDHLPYDVLRQLFEITHQAACFLNPESDPLCSSVHLSHISRNCRGVALSIPKLWPYISISRSIAHDPPARPNARIDRTKACLGRSKDSPLFISISTQDEINEIIDLLLPHSHRWHTIKIEAPSLTHQRFGRADNFDSVVSISTALTDTLRRHSAQISAYKRALNLKRLYMPEYTGIPIFNFSMESLETWIGVLSRETLKLLTKKAQNLKVLCLIDVHYRIFNSIQPGGPSAAESFSLESMPSVDSLSYVVPEPVDAFNWVAVLPQFPALRRLSICDPWARCHTLGVGDLAPFLRSFIESVPTSLTMLSLKTTLPNRIVQGILSSLPQQITHLKLELASPEGTEDILSSLVHCLPHPSRAAGFSCLFPRLEHLVLKQSNCIQPDFLPFFESRFIPDTDGVAHMKSSLLTYTADEALGEPDDCLNDGVVQRLSVMCDLGFVARVKIQGHVVFEKCGEWAQNLEREMGWDEILKSEVEHPLTLGRIRNW